MGSVEHEQKYSRLAEAIGIEQLRALVPVPIDRVRAALAEGDEYLNTIPLRLWDRAAGRVDLRWWKDDYRLHFRAPWRPAVCNGLSLAERVCVLKHVAREWAMSTAA